MLLMMIFVCVIGLILAILSMSTTTKKTSDSYYDLDAFGYKNGLMAFNDSNFSTQTGIDVSSHQGSIDWDAVKKSDISFAMIRCGYRGASEGALYEDSAFVSNIKAAKAAGLKVGVYWFSSAITVSEAKEEADYVLDIIKPYKITYPVVIDFEEISGDSYRQENLTTEELTDIIIAFCDKIEKAGYKPMIYSNLKGFVGRLDLTRLEKYEKWFAYYLSLIHI